jgi:hypothetical protein
MLQRQVCSHVFWVIRLVDRTQAQLQEHPASQAARDSERRNALAFTSRLSKAVKRVTRWRGRPLKQGQEVPRVRSCGHPTDRVKAETAAVVDRLVC